MTTVTATALSAVLAVWIQGTVAGPFAKLTGVAAVARVSRFCVRFYQSFYRNCWRYDLAESHRVGFRPANKI